MMTTADCYNDDVTMMTMMTTGDCVIAGKGKEEGEEEGQKSWDLYTPVPSYIEPWTAGLQTLQHQWFKSEY